MIYIFFLLFVGVQIWFAQWKGWLSDEKGKARMLMVLCAEMILLAMLRGTSVGADTPIYMDVFKRYSALPKGEVFTTTVYRDDFEWGYSMLTRLCAFIRLPEPFFLGVVAALIYIPVFYTIFRYSKIPYISILAYFATEQFAYSLGIFRQMIALSIVLCGLRFIEEKKLWKYALLVAVATLFHTTAIITIGLYFAYLFPIERFYKWILPTEALLFIAGRPIFIVLIKIFPKYAGYVNSRYDLQGGSFLGLIMLNVLLFALLYVNGKKLTESRLTVTALTVATLMQPVAYSMALLGRTIAYFSYFEIFAFSEIAFVMMNGTEVYSMVKGDLLKIKDFVFRCTNRGLALAGKCHLTVKRAVWAVFLLGLFGLAVLGLVGNSYVTPYVCWFMK